MHLYALTDLDASMRLCRRWLALGPEHIAFAEEGDGCSPEVKVDVAVIDRSRIAGTRTRPGLSCTVLTLRGSPGEPDLAVVRYTHRQKRAVENIQYALDHADEAPTELVEDADGVYAEAVAHPVRCAQASVHVSRRLMHGLAG